jgi:hypothetical protein
VGLLLDLPRVSRKVLRELSRVAEPSYRLDRARHPVFLLDRRRCSSEGRLLAHGKFAVPGRRSTFAVGQQLLGWLIKGYFLALMFTYMCRDLNTLFQYDFDKLTGFQSYFTFLNFFLYFVDATIAALGYIMSFG